MEKNTYDSCVWHILLDPHTLWRNRGRQDENERERGRREIPGHAMGLMHAFQDFELETERGREGKEKR